MNISKNIYAISAQHLAPGNPTLWHGGPGSSHTLLNDIPYFVSTGYQYNYADDNCMNVSHKDMRVLSAQLENETQVMAKLFADSSMKASADEFTGIILPRGHEHTNVRISLGV